MRTVHTIAELRAALADARGTAFVPTMGNLHAGHLSLVAAARGAGGPVVASIFVNRLQFGPNEDFDRYPRTLARDAEALAAAGCDLLFAPDERELYPEPQGFTVHPPAALADILEGAFRPGFFVGVCTVVAKLFHCVQPTVAVFSKKDYQQVRVVQGMARQMAMPVRILEAETVREPDGLALSSRNGFLSAAEREEAPRLHATLVALRSGLRAALASAGGAAADAGAAADEGAPAGGHGPDAGAAIARLESHALRSLAGHGWRPDYVAVRRRADLAEPRDPANEPLVAVAAARLGGTRLIDSLEL